MLDRVLARLTPVVTAVLVLLIAAGPAPAARDRCTAKGAKTVKQNSQVRVFKVAGKDRSTYYACLRGRGRPRRIAHTFNDPRSESIDIVRSVLVSGTSIVVVSNSFADIGPEGSESESILVADLGPGGRSYSVGVDTIDGPYSGFGRVLLRPDGAAAWALPFGREYAEIDVLGPAAERATPVAFAKGIKVESLAFAGDGVSWTQDGTTRTAAIP
jgi:hypothetical protein